MKQVPSLIKRFSNSYIPVIIMALFVVLSMTLLSHATENSSQFGRMHLALVVVNFLGMFLLLGLIGANTLRLLRQLKRHTVGSKLTTRMVLLFVVLSVAPVTLVYYFSIGFLQRGIDSWFDVKIERAMQDSLELSRVSLDLNKRELYRRTLQLAVELRDVPNSAAHIILDDLRIDSDAIELSLLTNSGQVIATSNSDTLTIIPRRPDEVILQEARINKSYTGMVRDRNKNLQIKVAVMVTSLDVSSNPRILYALYRVSERISELANGVEETFGKYKKQSFLREPLKDIFVLTLSLVLMLSLLTAVWVAFFSAQRLVAPIRVLAAGTRAVAAGHYDKRLPDVSTDELGELVRSFSVMTENLAIARDLAQQGQEEVEQQRAYLGAVLARLSSGVITLNMNRTIRVANKAASQLLDLDFSGAMGKPIRQMPKIGPHLEKFFKQINLHLDNEDDEWREEISIKYNASTKFIVCQGARLRADRVGHSGFVLVIDDVTMVMQSQRAAAWGDVARRLAHEVKNPLTPIQLSAERIKRKLMHKLSGSDADMVDRSTNTIVQQVETMKRLVQAFSEYARVPKIELQPVYIDTIVKEVLDLYVDEEARIKFETYYSHDHPQIEADSGRMRQLLNNLIKNAMESMKGIESPIIAISVTKVACKGQDFMELRVSDNGPGIPKHLFDRLFDPYTTTKSKGGGLGLTVVSRIVEEHSGNIFVENNNKSSIEPDYGDALSSRPASVVGCFNQGATFTIQIPALDSRKEVETDLYMQATRVRR
ncbi:MAG: ATP-binding protein [Thiohalomonadales bacterium]